MIPPTNAFEHCDYELGLAFAVHDTTLFYFGRYDYPGRAFEAFDCSLGSSYDRHVNEHHGLPESRSVLTLSLGKEPLLYRIACFRRHV